MFTELKHRSNSALLLLWLSCRRRSTYCSQHDQQDTADKMISLCSAIEVEIRNRGLYLYWNEQTWMYDITAEKALATG